LYPYREVQYSTFRQSKVARSFFADEHQFEAALEKGCSYLMPRQLRNMVATTLIYSLPLKDLSLQTNFKKHLSLRLMSSQCAEDICLTFLARKLEPFGLNL
jgi:hypothetical protein